jgi:hypothetical protein
MPLGFDVTEPLPETVTLSIGMTVNVALTACESFIVTVHAPVPVHAPVQPVNVESLAGVAVSVTLVLNE